MPDTSPNDITGGHSKAPATLSVPETAELLGVSEKTVRAAVEKGQIDAIRIGRMIRVLRKPLMDKLGMPDGA